MCKFANDIRAYSYFTFHLLRIEDKLCQGLDAGLKNKVLEMLNMANSCLTLHQILDGVKQNHQYLVSLRLKTVGSVRDFLVEHSRDFAVVDEMVCAVKDSKAGNYRIPQLQDVSDSAITKSKPCLKRSVSFADSKTITPVSSNTQPVANRAKAAFSKKIKVVEQRASSDHGINCACHKLSEYHVSCLLSETDLLQMDIRCVALCFLRVAKEMAKKSDGKTVSSQTEITFDPKESL